jgi:uncharacterized membrane protein YtjA (UPF0391 family)
MVLVVAIGMHRATEELSCKRDTNPQPPIHMLSWSLIFLIVALIAAALGFGGIAGTAAGIAKILFFVFLVLFLVSLLFGHRTPPV